MAGNAHACMVADALAWAVQHSLPLPNALRTLPFMRGALPWKRPLQALDGNFRLHCFSIPRSQVRWSRRIAHVIGDIEGGWSLGDALQNSLRRFLPDFFIAGVRRAEKEGRLATALPVLADQLRFPSSIKREVNAHLVLALSKFAAAIVVLHFIATVIVPRLVMIFEELGVGPMDGLTSPARVAVWVTRLLGLGVIVAFALPHTDRYAEGFLLRLPLVSRLWKRVALSELALSMAAFMRQGDDVLKAAYWSRSATRSAWIQKRLDEAIARMENGAPWAQAFGQAGIGAPLERWIMLNAADREDPASGFDLMADWQHQRISAVCNRIREWADPLTTLVMAAMVGYVAYYVFSCFTRLIHDLAMQ